MSFANPEWIFIGIVFCVLLVLFFRVMKRKRQLALDKFVTPTLQKKLTANVSGRKRTTKNLLILVALFFCFVSLAQPQYGHKWIDVKRKGIDLLFAIDTSKSMLAEDIKPNRLKRGHLAILDFIHQLEGDRVGLLPFAGSAYLMCPLTLDYEAFSQSLAVVSTDLIPKGGTNISELIEKATDILTKSSNHKILIILTDGENLEGDTLSSAKKAAELGVTIHTVGVGTPGGELIPLQGGTKGFIKDKSGNFVTSKLDENTLKEIAETTGGIYVPLGTAGEGLETVYKEKLALIPKEELAERRHKVPIDRSQWPMTIALILLVVEFLIRERKNSRNLPKLSLKKISALTKGKKKRTTTIAALLFFLVSHAPAPVIASEGEKAFTEGNYLQASEYYAKRLQKSPDDPQLNYNFATAAFKNNMFDDAVDGFTKALKSEDISLQKKAYFNRGNSYFSKGAEKMQAAPQETIESWKQALESMQAAIELDPNDARAQHNHDLIKKRLEELEQQQNNQQQNQQDNNQQKKQDKNDSNEDKQNQEQPQENSTPNEQNQQDQKNNSPSSDQKDTENGQNDAQQKATKPDEDDTIKPLGEDESKKQGEEEQKTPAQQAAADQQRRKEGKMTEDEARQLLDALKNEEGELNFVPGGSNPNNMPERDW